MSLDWSAEIPKALLNAAVALSVALVTLAAGSLYWTIRQKKRESLLATTDQFYAAYGEFFAVWKLWDKLSLSDEEFAARRRELLQRAASAEATTESILLKIVTELRVSEEEVKDLGRFRQAFQSLREAIQNGKPPSGKKCSIWHLPLLRKSFTRSYDKRVPVP